MVIVMIAGMSLAEEPYDKLEMPKFISGVCTHLPDKLGMMETALTMIRQAGVVSLRDGTRWSYCETQKGELKVPPYHLEYNNKAVAAGLMPLNLLCFSNKLYDDGGYPRSSEAVEGFARYCELMVRELKGKVRLHQIWNEWDNGCAMDREKFGVGTVEDYVRLQNAVYPRLKKIDPQAIIISNSVCRGDEWFEKMIQAGAMKSCDGLALHTYNYYDGGTPERWYNRMLKIRTMLHKYNNGKDFPLFITEMGYPTQIDSQGNTPEKSAAYLARLYLLARTLPFIKGIWWYDFLNDGWKSTYNENNFGIVNADLTPKPAYYVMSDISQLVNNADFVKRIETKDPDIWVLQFKYPGGNDVLAMWSTHREDLWQICLCKTGVTGRSVQAHHAGRRAYRQPWGARSWVENRQNPLRPDELEFCLSDLPLIIEGDLSNINIKSITRRIFPERSRGACLLPQLFAEAASKNTLPKKYHFGLDKNYTTLSDENRKNKDDLDASFAIQYDRENIYLTVEVKDNVFWQKKEIREAWQGDGLQLAFQVPDEKAERSAHTELEVALTPDGAKAYLREIQSGKSNRILDDAVLKISTQNHTTTYFLAVSWKALGLPDMDKGAVMKFSLLVNDNDGNGRKGYLHWGNGIGNVKNPEEYYMLLLN